MFETIEEREELYKRAAEKWGKTSQLVVALEEFAELSVEVAKHINGKRGDDLTGLVDELSDARIMIEQLEYNFNVKNCVQGRIKTKLNGLNKIVSQDGKLHPVKS